MKPRDMSVNALAKEFHISATRLNDIVRGRRGVTADTGSPASASPGHHSAVLAQSSVRV